MKVLIVTPHFLPENFKCNDMAFELQKRGHEVTVMTPIPDYPEGKFYKGYGFFKRRKETIDGVKIHRSFIIPRGNGSAMRLALNYLSLAFFSSAKALWFSLFKKFDTVIVHAPSPILAGIPAIIIKKLKRKKCHFWVLDLWPESLQAAGGINNKTVLGIFSAITKWIYRNSDTIMIGSKGYRNSISKMGKFAEKIEYFPNWVEDSLVEQEKNYEVPQLPEGFNVMVAGNIGNAQDVPHLLEAFKKLKEENINLIFVGDGRKRKFVEEFRDRNGLRERIYLLGKFPPEQMPGLFAQADLLFMALKDEPIFALTVPSRLQAYMSAGKPIVAMINGEGADLIREADCGWTVPAEDSESLAKLLLEVSKQDQSVLDQKGRNGKEFSLHNFDFKKCIDHLEEIIKR